MKYKLIHFKHIKIHSLLFFLLLLILNFLNLQAQDRKKLEADKARIEKEIKSLNNQLNKAQKEKNTSKNQLALIKKKVQEREKLIKNINEQITILSQEIDYTQKGINQLHLQIDSLKSEYAKIIRMLYKQKDKNSLLVLIYNSHDFNQAYQRMRFFKEYNAYRKMQADQIKKKESELENVNRKLENQKTDQAKLLAEEQQQKQRLSREQTQTQKSINSMQQQEQKISAELKKKREQSRQLNRQIEKIIAEEVRKRQEEKLARERAAAAARAKAKAKATAKTSKSAASPETVVVPKEKYIIASTPEEIELSNSFINNKGKLPWPVEKGAILTPYGEYTHAESHGKNFNNGITILTNQGSSVRSIFDGVVSSIWPGPNGQNVVIIAHGEFMTVYTNLEKVMVKVGNNVRTRQIIGIVSDTPENKQSEMAFQIWRAKTSINPAIWLAPMR